MPTDSERRVVSAVFRMVEARLGPARIAIFETGPDDLRLLFANPTLKADRNIAPHATEWSRISDALRAALRLANFSSLPDVGFILPSASGFILPFAGGREGSGGFLLAIADGDLDPGAVEGALQDAAEVIAPLLQCILARPKPTPGAAQDLPAAAPFPVVARAITRREARERIASAVDSCRDSRLSLILIDLDRFHSVNATLGAELGDAVLAVTAARIARILPRDELFLRLEGDHFAVLGARSAASLRELGSTILETIREPLDIGGRKLVLQASIGVVAGIASGAEAATALIHADSAVRRAKMRGRARVEFHEPVEGATALNRSRLELDLANALETDQLRVAYQPYIDLATGEASGVEALLRWRHPEHGDVQPSTFIPLAEASGLILPIGAWVLRTACREAAGFPDHFTLSVNISALQFHQPDFVAEVEAILAETGFPVARLELEITETLMMRDHPETMVQLNNLVRLGIRIALDDFGTGYSSLSYLARLPHHRIKLDHSFIRNLEDPAATEVVRAIIRFAQTTGVDITAEGVEDAAQVARVAELGFTHAQGFATGVPAPSPALSRERVVRGGRARRTWLPAVAT